MKIVETLSQAKYFAFLNEYIRIVVTHLVALGWTNDGLLGGKLESVHEPRLDSPRRPPRPRTTRRWISEEVKSLSESDVFPLHDIRDAQILGVMSL